MDKLNTFQVVLIERADVAPGDFDIEFNYEAINWETGTLLSENGDNGYGGNSARVGIVNGAGNCVELVHSGEPYMLLDRDPRTGLVNRDSGLVYQHRGTAIPGRLVFQVRNGVVLATSIAVQITTEGTNIYAGAPCDIQVDAEVDAPAGTQLVATWSLQDAASLPGSNDPPGTVTFSDPHALSTTATFSAPGDYRLRITVVDPADPVVGATDISTFFTVW